MSHSALAMAFGPAVVGWSDDPASDPASQQLVSRLRSVLVEYLITNFLPNSAVKNCENRSIFGEDIDKSLMYCFASQ